MKGMRLWWLPMLLALGAAGAAEINIEIRANRFLPETVQAASGDVLVFEVVSGDHQLTADPQTPITGLPSGRLTQGGRFELTITDPPGDYFFSSDQSGNFRGGVQVVGVQSEFAVDSRISSGWFNPAASGQGLLFEYVPSTNLLVAYWFTFDFDSGDQLWLVGSGSPDGGRVTLEMLSAVGGAMNTSIPVSKPVWGELTVDFSSCETATAYFNASQAQQSGQVPLNRLYLADLCDQE